MRAFAVLILSFVSATTAWTSPRADYVTYYAQHGDWTVACANDPRREIRYCKSSTPGPAAAQSSGTGVTLALDIAETGEANLLISVRGVFPRAKTARLVINGEAFSTLLSFHGEANWQATENPELFSTLNEAQKLSVEIDSGTTASKSWTLPIVGLSSAIAVSYQRLGLTP